MSRTFTAVSFCRAPTGPDTSWKAKPKGDDFLMFGYVCGHEREFGYFVLSELTAVRTQLGAAVERDLTFIEGRITDVAPAPDS